MKLLRISLTLLTALSLWANPQACFGQRQAKIDHFAPPVQNYAVIDLTPTPISASVQLIALNDANQVAFGFPTGSIPGPYFFGGDAQYHVYTWSNGTLSPEHTINGYTTATDPASGNLYESTRFEVEDLLSSGLAYGSLDNLSSNGTDYDTIGFTQAGDPGSIDAPSPPFDNYYVDLHGTFCQGATENGVLIGGIDEPPIGNDGYPWRYGCSFLMKNGVWTIFDPWNDYSTTTVPANVVIEPEEFEPAAANNQGQAIGSSDGGPWDKGMFWDGQKTIPVGPGYASDLNDQGQVTIQGYHYNTPNTEGAMWEGGNQITLRDQLPFWFAGQDWDIQPFSISNQVKVGQPTVQPALPDPTADATIHLLTTAQGVDVGAYGTMLWTRDNNGNWSFANVALPAGTSITDWTSINSSGVIAAIGNGGHALLLVPEDIIQVDAFIPQQWLSDPVFVYNGNSRKVPLDGSLTTGSTQFIQSGAYKMEQTIAVTVYKEADPSGTQEQQSLTTKIGPTKKYHGSAVPGGTSTKTNTLSSTAVPFATQTAVAETSTATVIHTLNRIVTVELVGKAQNPLANPMAPTIETPDPAPPLFYDITVKIDGTTTPPTYTLTGSHELFPAYEVYINGQLVHDFSPIPGGHGPYAMFLPASSLSDSSVIAGTTKPLTGPITSPP